MQENPTQQLNKKEEWMHRNPKRDLFVGLAMVVLIALVIFWYQRSGEPKVERATISFLPGTVVAPDFTLPATTGGTISLADFRGKKNVLLYFQEGVMCDPCWKQIVDIQKEYDKFKALEIKLITITVDPLNALKKNAKRFGLTLPVLADEDLKVSTVYDVLKESMHPDSRPGHTFVLVDKTGTIVWKKPYFLASGSTIMTMTMKDGSKMTMDMGMDMGTPESVMYVPVDKLLNDLKTVKLAEASQGTSIPSMSMQDHTMCLTPIHNHVDFKLYINRTAFNFSQRDFMDQSPDAHFHPTVKVRPEDVPHIPNGDIVHIHKDNVSIRTFFETLDLDAKTRALLNDKNKVRVYVNGVLQIKGLDYEFSNKEQILVTYGTELESEIAKQIKSVTNYSILGKEKNPSLFGGC